MPIAYASGVIKPSKNLTLEEARVLVEALVESAPRLAEMGVGGGFYTRYGANQTDITFALPNGTTSDLEAGWYHVSCFEYWPSYFRFHSAATAPFFTATQHIMDSRPVQLFPVSCSQTFLLRTYSP